MWALEKDEVELVKEKEAKLQLIKQISELEARFQKALMIIASRDILIKSHNNIFPLFRTFSKLESARKLFSFQTIRLTSFEKSG
jgi:hypothetical protein